MYKYIVSFQDYKPPKGVRFNDDVKVFSYGNSPMNRPLYNNNERTETVDEMVNNILTELINKVVDGNDHEKDVILDELPIGGKFLRMPAQLQYFCTVENTQICSYNFWTKNPELHCNLFSRNTFHSVEKNDKMRSYDLICKDQKFSVKSTLK